MMVMTTRISTRVKPGVLKRIEVGLAMGLGFQGIAPAGCSGSLNGFKCFRIATKYWFGFGLNSDNYPLDGARQCIIDRIHKRKNDHEAESGRSNRCNPTRWRRG
jgi:hypothetical protein